MVTETPLLAVDAFVLDCRAPWPAALLLSRRSVVKYQLAFRRVFRAKRVERRLLSCWTDQQASKRWCGRGATRSALAPAFRGPQVVDAHHAPLPLFALLLVSQDAELLAAALRHFETVEACEFGQTSEPAAAVAMLVVEV